MQTVAEQIAAALRGARLQSSSRAGAPTGWGRSSSATARCWSGWCCAQEQERSRVAADLHDDTVQVLSACVIALDRVRRAIEQGDVEPAAPRPGARSPS